MLAPQDAFRQNFAQTLRPPSAAHWFGTDQLGRDVLSRVLVGARATLGIGVGGVTVAFLVGVPLGILAAWRRGWIDAAVMRAIDIMLSFPDIVFALAVVAILGANTQNVIIAVGDRLDPGLCAHGPGGDAEHPRRALYRGLDSSGREARCA